MTELGFARDWCNVDIASFATHGVWGRPDILKCLSNLGPLVHNQSAMGEIAWTAEFGLLGLGGIRASRTSDDEARVSGRCNTPPKLLVTVGLRRIPGVETGEVLHNATRLSVQSLGEEHGEAVGGGQFGKKRKL